MSDNSLSLPPDVDWLINLPPTVEALRCYLHPPQHLPPEAPPGAHTLPFEVNQIFASSHGAVPEQRRHDLCGGEYLADLPGRHLVRADMDVTQHLCVSPQEHCHACCLHRDCQDIFTSWMGALALYERPERKQFGVHSSRLYLEPRWEPLPSEPFLRQLIYDYTHNLPLLILLTARHELGYVVQKVSAWKRKADSSGLELRPQLVGPCLDAQDWERLAARIRARISIVPISVDSLLRDPELVDLPPVRRHDAPIHLPAVAGDLSMLYAQAFEWASRVYYDTVNANRCPRCRKLLVYAGRGRRSKHCSECAEIIKAEQDAQRDQAKRRKRKEASGTAELRRLLTRLEEAVHDQPPEVRRHLEQVRAIMRGNSKK